MQAKNTGKDELNNKGKELYWKVSVKKLNI